MIKWITKEIIILFTDGLKLSEPYRKICTIVDFSNGKSNMLLREDFQRV